MANTPREEYEDGNDEESDLEGRADCDGEGEVELVFARDDEGRDVFCGVADDGEEDEAARSEPIGGLRRSVPLESFSASRTAAVKKAHDR